jgi:glycosyltransferase involved in cell wall biosynthesis
MTDVNINPTLGRYLHGTNPAVVITKGWSNWGYFTAQRYASKKHAPVISWVCGREAGVRGVRRQARRLVDVFARKAIRNSKFVFAYGSRAQTDAINLGAKVENVVITKLSIDEEHFDCKSVGLSPERRAELRRKLGFDETPLLLCISQLIERKGIRDLLSAFDVIKNDLKFQMLLIGSGPLAESVKEFVKENHTRCNWIPSVPYDQIQNYYAISDCFVFPTRFDVWGTVVNESHCAKLPIICSDGAHAGYDLIKHGHSGLVYPAGNVEALTKLMEYAVENPSKMRQMADNGYDFIQTQWNSRISARIWAKHIKSAIENNGD